MPTLTTPDVLTVNIEHANAHLSELLAFAESGGAVRVIDGRRPARQFWMSVAPPDWWSPELDDTGLLVAGVSRRLSDARRASAQRQREAADA